MMNGRPAAANRRADRVGTVTQCLGRLERRHISVVGDGHLSTTTRSRPQSSVARTRRRPVRAAGDPPRLRDRSVNAPGQRETAATAERHRPRMTLIKFQMLKKNTLRGFCVLDIPSGLIAREVSIHENNGKFMASLPTKSVLYAEGRQVSNHYGHRKYAELRGWRDRRLADAFSGRAGPRAVP